MQMNMNCLMILIVSIVLFDIRILVLFALRYWQQGFIGIHIEIGCAVFQYVQVEIPAVVGGMETVHIFFHQGGFGSFCRLRAVGFPSREFFDESRNACFVRHLRNRLPVLFQQMGFEKQDTGFIGCNFTGGIKQRLNFLCRFEIADYGGQDSVRSDCAIFMASLGSNTFCMSGTRPNHSVSMRWQ